MKQDDPENGLYKLLFVVSAFIISMLVLYVIVSPDDSIEQEENISDTPSKQFHQVRYEVNGSANTSFITYTNRDGGTSQIASQSHPWTYEFLGEEGAFVYVSAQNQGSSGAITVQIYVDDILYKTSTSSGGYTVAMASGSV